MIPSRVDALLRRSPSTDRQMWRCVPCGKERQWGFGKPENRHRIVLLSCAVCAPDEYIRHEYHGQDPRL